MNLSNDTHLAAPSAGHFDFQKLDGEGMPTGRITRINTATGLILNSHPKCDTTQVRHLADVARETPGYPVDISAWDGDEGDRRLLWWARIIWRGPKIGGR